VQFDSYGGVDVLEVRDVPRPVPGVGEALVEVKAAGINISEAAIRAGAVTDMFAASNLADPEWLSERFGHFRSAGSLDQPRSRTRPLTGTASTRARVRGVRVAAKH
jgi:hypothetical protein